MAVRTRSRVEAHAPSATWLSARAASVSARAMWRECLAGMSAFYHTRRSGCCRPRVRWLPLIREGRHRNGPSDDAERKAALLSSGHGRGPIIKGSTLPPPLPARELIAREGPPTRGRLNTRMGTRLPACERHPSRPPGSPRALPISAHPSAVRLLRIGGRNGPRSSIPERILHLRTSRRADPHPYALGVGNRRESRQARPARERLAAPGSSSGVSHRRR